MGTLPWLGILSNLFITGQVLEKITPRLEVIKLLPIFAQNTNIKAMPTVFILWGFVFKFYSNEHNPIHIHVLKGGAKAKYSIFPVSLVDNHGFKPSELKIIESIIEDNQEVIAEHWNRYFNKDKNND